MGKKRRELHSFRDYFNSVWEYSLQGKMAVCSFIMGCVIACICLFEIEPLGTIATSAISTVSMFLVLAGALVGVKVSFDTQARKFETKMYEIAERTHNKEMEEAINEVEEEIDNEPDEVE